MGSIFGIADLPVSTITSTVQIGGGMDVPTPEYKESPKANFTPKDKLNTDIYMSSQKTKIVSNPMLKMRNGFGKLMKHFSKSIKV